MFDILVRDGTLSKIWQLLKLYSFCSNPLSYDSSIIFANIISLSKSTPVTTQHISMSWFNWRYLPLFRNAKCGHALSHGLIVIYSAIFTLKNTPQSLLNTLHLNLTRGISIFSEKQREAKEVWWSFFYSRGDAYYFHQKKTMTAACFKTSSNVD